MSGVIANRGVFLAPIYGQADPPPQFHERLFIFFRQLLAEFDEIFPREFYRVMFARFRACVFSLKIRLIGKFRVAGHVKIILHPPFRRQPVVIPSHRIENVQPLHAFVARDDIRVRIAENMPHVERAGHGRRRRVNHKRLFARRGWVVAVNALLLPCAIPTLFGLLCVKMFGKGLRINPEKSSACVIHTSFFLLSSCRAIVQAFVCEC